MTNFPSIKELQSQKKDSSMVPLEDKRNLPQINETAEDSTGSFPSLDQFRPASKAEYFFRQGRIPEIKSQIKTYEDQIREYQEQQGGHPYLYDDEKQERVDEIDMVITKLQQEQSDIASRKIGKGSLLEDPLLSWTNEAFRKNKEIRTITERIKELTREQENLKKELDPVTEEEIHDISENYPLSGSFNILAMHEKYGEQRATKINTEYQNRQMDVLSKSNLRVVRPESVMSYDNLMFGDEPELKYLQETDLDKIWKEATNDPDWEGEFFKKAGNYDSKRKLLHKKIKEYIADNENIEDKEAASYNILSNMLVKFAEDPVTKNFTIEGLKLWGEHMLQRNDKMLEYIQSELAPFNTGDARTSKEAFANLEKQYGKKAVVAWYQNLQNEAFQLSLNHDKLNKIMDFPESRRGLKDIGKGLTAIPVHDLMLGIAEFGEGIRINDIVNKVNAGKELNFGEDIALKSLATLNYAGTYDVEGGWYITASGVIKMVPYIAEFLMTGPLYSFGRATTLRGATKLTTSLIGRQAKVTIGKQVYNIADLAATNLARMGGTAFRTLGVPQMVGEKTLENIRDDVILDPQMDGIRAKVIANTGDSFFKGLAKGWGSVYIELFTEMAGTHLMKAIPGVARLGRYATSKISGKEFIDKTILDNFMKVKGIKNIVDLDKYIVRHNLGWNGIMEEYLEEVANYYLETRLVTGERQQGREFWKNQLHTFMTVAMFGGMLKPIQVGASYRVGSKIRYQMKGEKGNTYAVDLPRDVHEDLMKIIKTPDKFYDEEAYQAFLDKHAPNLTKAQFDLVVSLTVQTGQDKIMHEIASKGPGAKGKVTIDETQQRANLPKDVSSALSWWEGLKVGEKRNKKNLTDSRYALLEKSAKDGTLEWGSYNFRGKEHLEPKLRSEDPFAPVSQLPPDLSKEDVLAIEKENTRIKATYPDLARLGLIHQDPMTGQMIEPTKPIIDKIYLQITQELAEKAQHDDMGNLINITPEVQKLSDQEEILRRYKSEMHDRSVPFEKLKVDQKQERIALELKEGNKLSGKTSLVTPDRFQVELKDGRKLDVYFHKDLPSDIREKAKKAILNHEEVDLKLQDYREWNFDLEIVDQNGKPYYDRIQAWFEGEPIGAVQVTDFAAQAKERRTAEQKKEERMEKFGDAFHGMFDRAGIQDYDPTLKVMPELNDEQKNNLKKEFRTFINTIAELGVLAGIELAYVIDTIIDMIRRMTDINEEYKGYMIAMVYDNKDLVEKVALQQQLKDQGLAKKVKKITIDEIVMLTLEGIAPSGAQKLDNFLNGYAPVWKTIADNLDTSKDLVEKTMYQIARQSEIMGNLQNEALLEYFLNNLTGVDRITDAIVDVLKRSSLSSVVSLINFYSNVRLTKQYGLLITKKGITWRLLNPSEQYDTFRNNFWSAIGTYQRGESKGYKAVMERIQAHNNERDREFKIKNQDYSWYFDQTPEERERLRREQHERDLQLLAEFTGIATDTWREYFSRQTKETMASSSRDVAPVDYMTYDNLLRNDTWRGKYPRIQSTLALNLSLLLTVQDPEVGYRRDRTAAEFKDAFNAYFTEGEEEKDTLSNLYKLSTAISERDEIGLSGVDIKSDHFSSFIQYSHEFKIAEMIRELDLDNHIVRYYRDQDKEMEMIFFNGLHNAIVNEGKKGTHNLNLSSEDLWLTQLYLFLQEEDRYRQWLGQKGDKPSVGFAEVPKIANPSIDQITQLKKKFPEFDEAVKWLHDNYIAGNKSFFSSFFPSPTKKTYTDLAQSFVYNFARNMDALIEIFHGSYESYDNLTDLIKRGGSTNSPGYRMNPYIEGGVGLTYRFAMIIDPIFLGLEGFDGEEFMLGEHATRMQVSMGSTLSKIDLEGNEILTTVKALYSSVDPKTRFRALTKTNRTNIDILAEGLPKNNKFQQVRDFMRKNGIDVLAFRSGTKKHEKDHTKKKERMGIKLWDENGDALKKVEIPEGAIFDRNTADLFIQQDLRHTTEAKPTKMPSQLLSNMLGLDHGPVVSKYIHQLQTKMIYTMMKEFDGKPLNETKIEWLKENVNQNTQPELYRLLHAGITPYEPSMANFMRRMLAGAMTRKALEIPINRVTTVEVLDPGIDKNVGLLREREDYEHEGEVYILLPQIAANIDGARYDNEEFKGNPGAAVEYVNREANKAKHRDLFDAEGNLMEWEIYGNDGIIPGELVISTRVPASGLNSHTVGRLRYKFIAGNFTMLDKKSQKASGSDGDGDQRFNQVFFKDKNGNIIDNDETKEGIANMMMINIAMDYANPKFEAQISNEINVHAYDKIVEAIRKKEGTTEYSFLDPRGWDRGRNENMVGVKMKGIMTDVVTVYGLIKDRKITFKKALNIPVGEVAIKLTGFVRDPKGHVRAHLENLLNLAFDNAADPKIETIGLNEVTANMFVIALLGNQDLKTTSDKAILEYIGQITGYFSLPLVREFTRLMRKNSGGMRSENNEVVKEELKRKFGSREVDDLFVIHHAANEFPDIRRFYSLTQKTPGSVIEYKQAEALYDKIRRNSPKEFTFLDVGNLFDINQPELPVIEFRTARASLDAARDYIFADTFDESTVGKEIFNQVLTILRKDKLTLNELKSFSYGLNSIAIIKALGLNQSMKSLYMELTTTLRDYRNKFPENKFLQSLWLGGREGSRKLEINPDYRQSKIGEENLAAIRNDFNQLSEVPGLQDKLVSYALHRWGSTTSTWSGSYYSLLSDEYRVGLSRKVQNEVRDWQLNEIGAIEKLQILEWLLRGSKQKSFREKSTFNPAYASYYDYNSMSTIEFPISYEALEGMHGVTNQEEFREYATNHNFDEEALRGHMTEQLGNVKVKEFARQAIEGFKDRAIRLFPPSTQDSGHRIRDLLPSSVIGEALASEDPELQEFIFNHLKKEYPGVQFFTDRDAFYAFVLKHGGRGLNINPEAIGHAFKNAIFLNLKKATQDAHFHEHAHIYWDALAENHPIKVALRELFAKGNEGKFDTQDDLDEEIIHTIGMAGLDMTLVKLRGSRMEKFLELLKQFWVQIKRKLGFANQKDLVRDLTERIWNNSDKINPTSAQGRAVIHNMIKNQFPKDGMTYYEGDPHTYYLNGMPVPSVTTVINSMMSEHFDGDAKAMQVTLKFAKMYRGLTRETLTKEEIREETQAIIKLWEGKTESGDLIHKIAESVFGGKKIITKEQIDQFEDPSVYRKIRMEFEQMKSDILDQYPNAEFYPEEIVFSKKYNAAGTVDLIVETGIIQVEKVSRLNNEIQTAMNWWNDLNAYQKSLPQFIDDSARRLLDKAVEEGKLKREIGEHRGITYTNKFVPTSDFKEKVTSEKTNELLIYDFKTTDEEYADEDQVPLLGYKRSYGVMKPPFQNMTTSKYSKHMLQTNMYANVLEEQEDPKKPGQKNRVTQIRIVPIVRTIDQKTAKIKSAKTGNWVRIPRNDKSIKITDGMMKHNNLLRQEFMSMYPEMTDNLRRIGVPEPIIQDILTAYHFFRQMVPDLTKMDRNFIGEIRNVGMQSMRSELVSRGFNDEDFRGDNRLTSEQLFYLTYVDYLKTIRRGDKDFREQLEKNFPEQIVYARLKAMRSESAKKEDWHRIRLYEHDEILQDIGIDNVQVGDEIMIIYDIQRPSGTTKRNVYTYRVLSVNKKGRKVKVLNHETSSEDEIYVPGKKDGLLKRHDALPEGVKDPGPASYIPRFIYEAEEVKERHFKTDITIGDYQETVKGEQERMLKERQLREVWRFFTKYDSWDELEEFLQEERSVIDVYEKLASINEQFAEHLSIFLRDEAMNHFMAGAIRREHSALKGAVPNKILPMTLNLYYLLTKNPNAIWGDFQRLRGIRGILPPRMIQMKYVPISIFTTQTQLEFKKYASEGYDLAKEFGKYDKDRVDYSIAIENDEGTLYWRIPVQSMATDHPMEFDFLTMLYKYYENFDPEHREIAQAGRRERIQVSQIYMSSQESIDRYKHRFGHTMYRQLRPREYDDVKLELFHGYDGYNKPRYVNEDNEFLKKGEQRVIRTLGQIKESFAFERMTNEEKAEFFGTRWQHIKRIPGTVKAFGKAGQLNEYIKKAKIIYSQGGDHINLKANIDRSQRRISVLGRGQTEYMTHHFVEAEHKVIDSMIYRHYLKRMIAPLDYMMGMYANYTGDGKGGGSAILDYIKQWGEYQLFKIKPEDHLFGGETISDLVDFGNRANSLNKIMFSIKTQFINLSIGQAMDIIREPAAYGKGLWRLFGSGNRYNNILKAWHILKRYKLANIVSDVTFDQIDKEFRIFGLIDLKKIEDKGYFLMELAEKMNQIPIFVGLMTDEEWNAYNPDGTVNNRDHMMSIDRARMIETRVQDIHGDYTTMHAAPFWLTNLGKAAAQFRKWLPAMLWAHASPYHIDMNLAVRSGILPAIHLAGKVLWYNSKTTQAEQEKRAKDIQEMSERGDFDNEAFFGTTNEYFNVLMKSVNGNKIKWRDLSPSDQRNLRAAAIEALFLVGMHFTIAMLLQGDDEKSYMKYAKRMFLPLFIRFQGDVFWIFTPSNWEYLNEGIIPMTSILFGAGQFLVDFQYWTRSLWNPSLKPKAQYNKDTLLAVEGTPKFLISSTYIVPGGSAIRWLQQRKRIAVMKRNKIDLSEFDLSDEELRSLGLNESEISEFDLWEKSYKYKRIIRDIEQAAKWDALIEKGIDPGTYMDLETGEDWLRSEADQLKEALRMLSLERLYQEDLIDLDDMQEKAAEWRKYESARSATRKQKKIRKFEEAIEELNR